MSGIIKALVCAVLESVYLFEYKMNLQNPTDHAYIECKYFGHIHEHSHILFV